MNRWMKRLLGGWMGEWINGWVKRLLGRWMDDIIMMIGQNASDKFTQSIYLKKDVGGNF